MSRPAKTIFPVVLAAFAVGCGPSQPEPDPVVLDRHFNNMIAAEEAERARLVEEARAREDVRAREMDERRANFIENSSANGQ
jgi:hypothetical protein